MVSTGAGTVVEGDWLAVDGVVARLEGGGMVFSNGMDVVVD